MLTPEPKALSPPAQEVTQGSSSHLPSPCSSPYLSTLQLPSPPSPSAHTFASIPPDTSIPSPVRAAQLSLNTSRHDAPRVSLVVVQSSLVSYFYKTSGEVHATGPQKIPTNHLQSQARASTNMLLPGENANLIVEIVSPYLRWN